MRFIENGKQRKVPVPPTTSVAKNIAVKSATQPDPVEFKIFNKATDNLIPIGGKDSVSVTPTLEGETTKITVGEGKINMIRFGSQFYKPFPSWSKVLSSPVFSS